MASLVSVSCYDGFMENTRCPKHQAPDLVTLFGDAMSTVFYFYLYFTKKYGAAVAGEIVLPLIYPGHMATCCAAAMNADYLADAAWRTFLQGEGSES